MRYSNIRTRLLVATAGVGMVAGVPAYAQDQDESAPIQVAGEEDTIVVSGFRASLENALNRKRNSGNIIDAISSEDIGKSTDQNIAEALNRVTGISIGREDGEGTTITARGIGADLNNITLNGVPLTSSGDNQGVNLSEFSSDILQAIEVQKTPSASTDEGSLGASVRLIGFRPLDVRKNRRSITVEGRYNDFREASDYKLSAAFSQKLFDNRVGVSLVATSETQSGRRDRIENPWNTYNAGNFRNGANVDGQGVVLEYDVNGDGVVGLEGGGREFGGISPNFTRHWYERNSRDRDTVQGGLQLNLWEGSDILYTATWTEQTIGRDNSFAQASFFGGNPNSDRMFIDSATRTVTERIRVALTPDAFSNITNETRGNPPGNARDVGTWRHGRDVTEDKQETWVHSLSIEQELGEFTFNLRGGRSETTQRDSFQLRSFWRVDRFPDPYDNSLLAAGHTCANNSGILQCQLYSEPGDPNFTSNTGVSLAEQIPLFDNVALFEPQAFTQNNRFGDDVSDSVYFDVEWDRQFGPITSLEFGGKWQNREKVANSFFVSCNTGCLTAPIFDEFGEEIGRRQLLTGLIFEDFVDGSSPANYANALGYSETPETDGLPIIDIFGVFDLIQEAEAEGLIQSEFNPVSTRTVEQEVYGAYAQANFELFDGRVFGDLGIRYAETDVVASAPGFIQFNQNSNFQAAGNLEVFGFFGDGDARNTATQAEAQAALEAQVFPLVGLPAPGEPRNGRTSPILATATHSYDNWLPSLNLNWLATDDLIVRFAASETIARPRINNLSPQFNINEQVFGERSSGSIGATTLNPFRSQNLDLSIEWYFDEGSLLSVALFNKNLKDFEQRVSFESFYRDVRSDFFDVNNPEPDPNRAGDVRARAFPLDVLLANGASLDNILIPFDPSGSAPGCMPERVNQFTQVPNFSLGEVCDVAALTTTQNGSGGFVRGVEVSLTHSFDNWPGFWGGLGFTANYTYSDSQQDAQPLFDPSGNVIGGLPDAPFENTSKHNYNVTMYWEKDGSLVRLAYSGRTDFLLNRISPQGFASEFTTWREGFESLDLSANWRVNRWVNINFQAINLLDNVSRTYMTVREDTSVGGGVVIPAESSELGSQYRGRTSQIWNTGRIFRLGARLNF